jgi:hypothetical protein
MFPSLLIEPVTLTLLYPKTLVIELMPGVKVSVVTLYELLFKVTDDTPVPALELILYSIGVAAGISKNALFKIS